MKPRIPIFMLVLAAIASPGIAAQTLEQRETELLAQVRKEQSPYVLAELAHVREWRGRFNEAIATWGLIKQRWPRHKTVNQSSGPTYTYGTLADFTIQRLRRKQNLTAGRTQATARVRRQAGDWLADNRHFAMQQEGHYEFFVQADLDGDTVDEIFFAGKYGTQGKRTRPFMGIARWNGSRYQVVYRAEGKNRPRSMPYAYLVVDEDGDGWKEVVLHFTPDSDDVASLHFNGQTVLML